MYSGFERNLYREWNLYKIHKMSIYGIVADIVCCDIT